MFEADANIIGVRLLVGNDLVEGGVSLEGGSIAKVGKEPNLPKAGNTYDAKGLVAIPGLIDPHVHLRDLQLAYKEDFYTGTCAAAAGGFTTVLDMPNTVPPTISAANLRLKRDAAIGKVVVNVGFHAGLVEDQSELQRMNSLGVFSFKLYMNQALPQLDTDDKPAPTETLSTCAMMKRPVTVHAEDRATIDMRSEEFRGKPLRIDDYLYIHGPDAEIKAVRSILEIAGKSGATLHLCHISLGPSIEAIEEARLNGIKISCEVTPHHLLLSRNDLERFGGWALSDPPLRDFQETNNLWKALLNLDLIAVASDHAPHDLAEKRSQDAREIKPGIPGLETTLPLLLTRVNRGELSLAKLVEVSAERPAKIFGLGKKGRLTEGADADITLLDLNREHVVDPDKFHSKARYSPFAGQKCQGGVSRVFVGGQIVYDDGEIVAPPGTGRILEAASR